MIWGLVVRDDREVQDAEADRTCKISSLIAALEVPSARDSSDELPPLATHALVALPSNMYPNGFGPFA